jgi:hypothetical protein
MYMPPNSENSIKIGSASSLDGESLGGIEYRICIVCKFTGKIFASDWISS